MKRCLLPLALTLGCAGISAAEMPHVKDELLVKMRPSARSMAPMYHRTIGATVVNEFPQIGWQVVKLPATVSVQKAIGYYRRLSAVQAVEPNGFYHAFAPPNDPLLNRQYSATRMKTDLAWGFTQGDDRVVVAVLDTGVDYTHPDLAGKVTKGKDWADNDDDPMDGDAHGTHVAGIAAARTNNGVGIAGMGYNTHILAIRVLGPAGGQWEWIAGGIIEAADKGADVINLSLGGLFASQLTEDAINYAWNKGALVVAAAGNDPVTDPHYPAYFPTSLAVGASDKNDRQSNFTTYGDWVDVAAPGVAVLSTVPGGGYEEFDGTSMACPNAAGVAALIISYAGKGNITNAEVRQILEETADPIGNWIVFGRINAEAAVQRALPPLIENRGPSDAKMYADSGTAASGTAASMAADDSTYFTVTSRAVKGLGGVAGAEVKFDYPHNPDEYLSGSVTVRSRAKFGATVTAYIIDNGGGYHVLKSWPVTGTEMSFRVNVPRVIGGRSLDQFVRSGKITMVFRSVVPTRYGTGSYAYAINSARLETRTAQRQTP